MPLGLTSANVDAAVRILRAGGLVAFPTETVYGLGADADNAVAVASIFKAKGRPAGRPLTIHIGTRANPQRWCHWTAQAQALADRFWPGPLTLILPKREGVSDIVTGGLDTVGIRMPRHPMALALLDGFGGGVAAPSANRTGKLSPTTAAHVRDDLGDRIDLVLDGGPCPVGVESTVLSLVGPAPAVLRLGAVPRSALEDLLGPLVVVGQAEPHYQPETQVIIGPVGPEPCGVIDFSGRPEGFVGTWIQAPRDPIVYARHLYTWLRQLDTAGHQRIFVAPVPDEPAWETVADRLAASANTG